MQRVSPTQAPLRYNLSMKKAILALLFSCVFLHAAPVAPGDYTIREGNTTSYIYPKNSTMDIAKTARYQSGVMSTYKREYGYRLDQRLYLTIGSQDDQIANAFSTQFPLNEQVHYGGGVGHYDAFASTSWHKMLQIHETAHNYQLNPKENALSKIAHAIAGNSTVVNPLFLPMFPIPNITASSFILEGNAVMNESRFGNGGRLYAGYALAETVTQARAGSITPARMYNRTLRFPYGEKFYLVGGYFQKFLVQRYGVKRVNGYFRSYAKQPFPFFGNSVFREHYGKDFVTLMGEFQRSVLNEHRGYQVTQGRVLTSSKVRAPLVRQGGRIVTLVGDRISAPNVMTVGLDGGMKLDKGDWHTGRLFQMDGRYYTQSAARISPRKLKAGLFDRDGYIKAGTEGKVIQGTMRDGRLVYFDVARSWDEPHLYVGGHFYGIVNSSVLVQGDDLYYFRQHGERRTLYRNRTPLISYRGHDGRVVDVDRRGRVYFIAPSRHGSTAYRVRGGRVERVSPGDDVIDLKLHGRREAVVQTITAKGYRLQQIGLRPRAARVADIDPGLPQVRVDSTGGRDLLPGTPQPYSPIARLRYSSLSSGSTYDRQNGYGFSAQLNFTDPLWRNTLSFVLRYRKKRTIYGAAYRNSAYGVHFGFGLQGVKKHAGYDNSGYRDYGYSGYLTLPFLATGYWRGSATLAYARPLSDTKRQPLSLTVGVTKRVQHGHSKYPNTYLNLSAFASYDRGAVYSGVRGAWMQDLPGELYVGVRGAYLQSSLTDTGEKHGIKAGAAGTSASDPAVLNIPTMSGTSCLKRAAMAEAGIYKVWNFSAYSYHLPLSLQRESVYLKQRIYRLDTGRSIRMLHETLAGIEADLLALHRYTVPVKLEVLYNPDIQNKVQVRVGAKYRF